MKILITGSTSKTAEALYSVYKQETDHELVMLSSSDILSYYYTTAKCYKVSIADFNTINSIIEEENPDVIINTAAQTNVDRCETEKRRSSVT